MVTNLILNLHIVVVESIVEVAHAYEYADPMLKLNGTDCDNPESKIFNVTKISDITLYLYPFGVEFVGIGGLFFYDMYNKIGNM